jgi:hypothetical protein
MRIDVPSVAGLAALAQEKRQGIPQCGEGVIIPAQCGIITLDLLGNIDSVTEMSWGRKSSDDQLRNSMLGKAIAWQRYSARRWSCGGVGCCFVFYV